MDILRLLDDLTKMIDDTPHWGPVTWGLNRDEISMQIAKVRASLPQELKAAVSTVRESDRILEQSREDAAATLDNARKESERIVTESKREADRITAEARLQQERIVSEAKLQQERMVAESEILKLSKAQSEEIRNAADRDSVTMRRGAEKYAYDVLSQLEGVVGKVMTTIERGKSEMQPAPAERTERAPVPQPREKARV